MRTLVTALGKVVHEAALSGSAKLKRLIEAFGSFIMFSVQAVGLAFHWPMRGRLIFQQLEFIGNRSLGIVMVSGFFIGAVFSLQIGHIFRIFGAQAMLGAATAKALTRELSPLVTGFLLAGRGGAAITAEIGTMKVNEQIDAMEAMAVDPISYLVGPRLVAAIVMLPVLVAIFNVMGMLGATTVGVVMFDVDQAMYWDKITRIVKVKDIWAGLEKSFIFGAIISLVACRYGLETKGGARGVGSATTDSVVSTLLTLIGVDFIITFFQIVLA